MKKKCSCIYKKINLFSTYISFHINNSHSFRSIFGGLITIVFLFIVISFISYHTFIFIFKLKIEYIHSNTIANNCPFINLTDIKFNLGFGLQFTINGTNAFESYKKYFDYSMNINEWFGGPSTIKNYKLNLKYCDINDFDYHVNDTFYNIKLNKFYCPIIDDTTNFTLEGLYTDKYFKFVEIIFKLNEYSKNHLNELKEFMIKNPVEMIIYLMDSSINYEDRKNPISKYMNEINKWLDFENRKETQISLSDVEFEDDQHYYFNSINKRNVANLDSIVDSFRFIKRNNNLDDDILGSFIIKASYKKIKFKRIYQKLPNFLAQISGLIEFSYLISFIIVRFLDKNLIDKIIIKKMFKYRGNNNYNFDYLKILYREDQIKKDKLKQNKSLNLKENKIDEEIDNENNNNNDFIISSQRTFNNNETNNKNIKYNNYFNTYKVYSIKKKTTNENNNSFQNKSNIYSTKNSNLKFINYFNKKLLNKNNNEYQNKENINLFNLALNKICKCFCNSKNKVKYNIIQNKINYYLDILFYINKIQEIDLIKYILFDNNNQTILFEYLTKPIINFNEYENIDNIKIKKYKKKDYENLYDIYKEININNKINNNISNIEAKLINLFNKEIDY